MTTVQTGLERLIASPPEEILHSRLGLLCNPASVDAGLRHARVLIAERFAGNLVALYAPQHGFFAEKQDNMIESADMIDPLLKTPVYSLYGRTRIPSRQMLAPVDMLIIDLQDVGTRVYTFITTLSYCLEAAKEYGKKVLVLDRPNPINGEQVQGNCLKDACRSFVGRYPLPMRHGLTIGELALLFNQHFGIGCDLEVIGMHGWQRAMFFRDTGLPWVAPSPNLPTPEAAVVYPGQVLWEGTNVSEGRGTTQPFELFGAPYFDIQKILTALESRPIDGAVLRPAVFEPTANKWHGSRCRGFQIHITDPRRYRPYETSLRLLRAVIASHPHHFKWKAPPYEYEYERQPIDLIIGDADIRRRLESLESIGALAASWQPDLENFKKIRRNFLLYP